MDTGLAGGGHLGAGRGLAPDSKPIWEAAPGSLLAPVSGGGAKGVGASKIFCIGLCSSFRWALQCCFCSTLLVNASADAGVQVGTPLSVLVTLG